MMLDNLPPAEKVSLDIISIGVVIATMAKVLPSIAALLTIVWTIIRIFETETIRAVVARVRRRKGDDR